MPGRSALVAGLFVALHPALVPYTAAIMTEGVTSSLLLVAAALGAAAREGPRSGLVRVAAGLVMGVATLVRPQCLALAPVLGWLSLSAAVKGWRRRLAAALSALGLSLIVCSPWTVRNCVRMDRCALVSVNGGWNLLIGAETDSGGWTEVVVPDPCREVWSEAGKDTCFEKAARQVIARDAAGWLARVPRKLGQTFDYIGAAPWYLHLSNPDVFDDRAKLALGSAETLVTRLLLALALVGVARTPGARTRARWAVAALGVVFAVLVHAWVAYLALAVAALLRGAGAWREDPVLVPWTAAVVLVTAATHAAFFGAGRYGLVVLPFVALLAAGAARQRTTP